MHYSKKLKNTRDVKMDKKRFKVLLCFEMYEKAIILIFDLWLLIIFAFFICI